MEVFSRMLVLKSVYSNKPLLLITGVKYVSCGPGPWTYAATQMQPCHTSCWRHKPGEPQWSESGLGAPESFT
ncbi:hypothetical protein Y1Q_0007910 [Alligator mississippiensis]|uniref:Uncharacterized protein n=1 Tax=Alligator mississippiensis TaxID=8496 RepID=A0A151NET9_ALLMI|nr:hypothetical protein Y1Q_0007910 [Alligator mississippiensis]